MVLLVQFVEQRALELVARRLGELVPHAAPHRVPELVEVVEPEPLGKLVVDRQVARCRDHLHLDVEGCRLAGQRGRHVVGRKRDLDLPVVARSGAEQLGLEARDEGFGPEHDVDVLAAAALEHLAVHAAFEIDRHAVAIGRRRVVALLGRVGAVLLAHPVQRASDLRLVDVGHLPLQLDGVERAGLEARQRFDRHREGQVTFGLHGALDLGLVAGQVHLRLQGEA